MAPSKSELVIGYLSALGSILAACASASCTQALQGAIPDFQLSVARSLVQCIAYTIIGRLVGSFNFKRETIPGLLYLGLLYLVFNVGYYGSTTYLPLTEAYGMLVIVAIVTAFLHSRVLFNIEITKSKLISLMVCVIGIIMAAQPSWLFYQWSRTSEAVPSAYENISYATIRMNISSQYETGTSKGEVVLFGYILSAIGGAGMGLMYDTNGIILKDIKPIVKIMYAATFCMIGSVVFMFYMEDPVLMIGLTQFMLVLGHGVLSTFNSFLFTVSAHYIAGPTLSAVYSFQMVLMIISQYTIMHSIKPGNYNWIEVLGCIVIIFGGSIPSLVDILMYRAKSNQLP